MPVRFRCVYCNQLLGISRRKAGTVVRCTNCGGQIIVPEAEQRQPEVAAVGGDDRRATRKESLPDQPGLLEHGDFDALLKPFAGEHPKLDADATTRTPSSQELFPIPEKQNAPTKPPVAPALTPRTLLISVGLGMLIVGLIVGYFIGRSMSG